MTRFLLHPGQFLFPEKRILIGDEVFKVLGKSFKYKDNEVWEYANMGGIYYRVMRGEHIVVMKFKKRMVLTGADLSLKFNRFEEFGDHFDFDRYYAIRIYGVVEIRRTVEQKRLDEYF